MSVLSSLCGTLLIIDNVLVSRLRRGMQRWMSCWISCCSSLSVAMVSHSVLLVRAID